MIEKVKVVIVDDDPLFRKALTKYIHQHDDLRVIGEASDSITAVRAVSKLKPDIALVDILGFEGEEGGIQIIRKIKSLCADLTVLAISSHDASLYAKSALEAGAKGYLMKQEAADKIGAVVRQTMKGEMYVSGEAGSKIIRSYIKNTLSEMRH